MGLIVHAFGGLVPSVGNINLGTCRVRVAGETTGAKAAEQN